jgi:DeoR/GlpR family transcriptional regulator of sugar metabolism
MFYCMVLHERDSDSISAVPAERQRRILARLTRDGQVNASVLAKEFSTSEDTIRRDLRDLATQGLCQRVYGGAILLSEASAPIAVRVAQAHLRKDALGQQMARLLRDGQFVFIDAGSTNLAFARSIPSGLKLTVATHSPSIAACLVGKPGIDLIVVGGSIHPSVGAALGGRAVQEISGMRPDLLVLGACSLNAEQGIGAFDFEDAHLKSVMIERAGSVAIALLNEKFPSASPHAVAPIESLSDVVVEVDAPSMDMLSRIGVRVHRAAAASNGGEGSDAPNRNNQEGEA